MKKYLNWGWVAINVVILIILWFTLFRSAFSGIPMKDIINLDWWYMFILVDLWTAHFTNNLKLPGRKDEGQ